MLIEIPDSFLLARLCRDVAKLVILASFPGNVNAHAHLRTVGIERELGFL